MTQETQDLFKDSNSEFSNKKYLFIVSATASLILGVSFLIAAVGFVLSLIWSGNQGAWLSLIQGNWLIVIFKLHAGIISIDENPLYGLNLIDMVILALFCVLSFGLGNILKKDGKIMSFIAFALSFITIILFIVTQIAGRSTVMLSVLIFSFIMLRNKNYKKVTIYAGILAGIFLFTGDLTVDIHSNFITILFGIGYVLLILWFFLVARIFIRLKNQK